MSRINMGNKIKNYVSIQKTVSIYVFSYDTHAKERKSQIKIFQMRNERLVLDDYYNHIFDYKYDSYLFNLLLYW